MRKTFAVALFVAATFTWTFAQTGSMPQNGQQPPSASQQAPGSAQSMPSTGSTAPNAAQDPAPSTASAPVTEGCLGGSAPNFTLTDKAGTTYKLNLPPNANASVLTPHLGESIMVMGNVNNAGKSGQSSIDVTKAGKGTSTCPAGSATKPQTPKQ